MTIAIEVRLWAALAVLIYALVRAQGLPSVGLLTGYIASLAVNHLVGGFIHALPWYAGVETPLVEAGFRESLWGLASFGVAALVLAPMVAGSRFRGRATRDWPRVGRATGRRVLLLGVFFYFAVVPVLSRIPSFGAVAGCGPNLVILGFCLLCLASWQEGRLWETGLWLVATLSIPAVTVLMQGFLGYGIVAMLVVAAFVGSFYTPRWHLVVGGALVLYLGLSLYVNYMRERDAMREAVWGGQGMSARLESVLAIFREFALFDVREESHLERVDVRLNQNYFVGAAVIRLEQGGVDYARGETIRDAFLALVPRIIWPSKPMQAGSMGLVARFTGLELAEGTSFGIGHVLELYVNFGRWGILVGFGLLGFAVRWADMSAGWCLARGDLGGFALWFLPGLSFLNTIGSLVELTMAAASSLLLALLIRRFMGAT